MIICYTISCRCWSMHPTAQTCSWLMLWPLKKHLPGRNFDINVTIQAQMHHHIYLGSDLTVTVTVRIMSLNTGTNTFNGPGSHVQNTTSCIGNSDGMTKIFSPKAVTLFHGCPCISHVSQNATTNTCYQTQLQFQQLKGLIENVSFIS